MRLLYLLWLNVPLLRPLVDRLMGLVFGRLAGQWDQRAVTPGRLEPLQEAISRLDAPVRRILEMGCGTGKAAMALSEQFQDAWTVGVDVSPEMIEHATRSASASGSAVVFEVAKIQRTDFDDESFDLIVLVNAPPPFKEIGRLLRRGGHAIVVFTNGPETPFYSSHSRLERGFRRSGMLMTAADVAGPGEFLISSKR